jgi:hypothetical protein
MIVSMLAASLLLAQGAPAAAEKANDMDKVVCKNEAAPGSRLPKKVCATKGEWERRKQEARDALEKSQVQRPLNGQ